MRTDRNLKYKQKREMIRREQTEQTNQGNGAFPRVGGRGLEGGETQNFEC